MFFKLKQSHLETVICSFGCNLESPGEFLQTSDITRDSYLIRRGWGPGGLLKAPPGDSNLLS